jgi:ubiquinol-cytochrome c reductase cytochrome b subunit
MTQPGRFSAWLEERTGYETARRAWRERPMVGGARWAYSLGPALGLTLAVQAVTGALLMTAYAPSVQTAWASVHYISYTMSGGWLVRGMHHVGSDATVVLLGLHLFQSVAYAAYKRPREVTWWLGLALLGLLLGLAVTGYLLPWDQKGYWARRVETNIVGAAPLIGGWLQALIQGGSTFGTLTLTRFYALHVFVLPALALGLVAVYGALARKHGNTPLSARSEGRTEPYYPNQVARNLVAGLVVLAVILVLTFRSHGAALDAPADPNSDYPARPEWYLLWLFRLMHSMGGKREAIVALLLPVVVGGYFALLPLLDRKPRGRFVVRVLVLLPAVGLVGAVSWLSFVSVRADAADVQFQAARRKAEARAAIALELAKEGVPPAGPLAMLRADPGLHGEELFAKNCAACHVLSDVGDRKKATAPALDGWGTPSWILRMIHEPDGEDRFGRTPYKGEMPSVDMAPKDRKPDDPPFKPLSPDDMRAVSAFLSLQGAENGSGMGNGLEAAARKAAETIVTTRCTTCHLWKGEGDDGDQGLAPELSGYGSLAWVRAQIANPATKATYREKAVDDPKHKGHMPHFAGEIAEQDIDLLARWTWARGRGVPMIQAGEIPKDARPKVP